MAKVELIDNPSLCLGAEEAVEVQARHQAEEGEVVVRQMMAWVVGVERLFVVKGVGEGHSIVVKEVAGEHLIEVKAVEEVHSIEEMAGEEVGNCLLREVVVPADLKQEAEEVDSSLVLVVSWAVMVVGEVHCMEV